MPICKKCNNRFPNRKKIDGKNRNLGNRKYCLDCSPFGSHNTKKLERFNKLQLNQIPDEKLCPWCGITKSKQNFYLRKDRNTLSGYCKKCSGEVNLKCQKTRAKTRKIELVKIKGGKCSVCGYDKNLASLTFHHRDPKDKEIGLSVPNLRAITWEQCLIEAEKCDVLCANCHIELHNSNSNDWQNYSPSKPKRRFKMSQPSSCIDCLKKIYQYSIRCRQCSDKFRIGTNTKIEWPPIEELIEMVENSSYTATGKKLGVSDVAVRKHIKKYS